MMFVHLCQEGVYERWREWICWENIRKELPLVTALKLRMERAMGVEPTSKAWEAFILPMNYARGRYAKYCIID